MDKIAVFGGAFDPVHKAHVETAEFCVKTFGFKRIIFVPAYSPPHKTRELAGVSDRIKMLKLAVKKIPEAEINTFEVLKKETVYAYQTLDYFRSLYPRFKIRMLIGSDSLIDLPKWKNPDYIAQNYGFIVAERPGFKTDKNLPYFDKCLFLGRETQDISSSRIRNALSENLSEVLTLIDEEVYNYIKRNGLYKK